MMNAVTVLQSAAPLLLRSMGQDLLHLIFHGTPPQAATALQLAAAAHKHMDVPPMIAADRETVRPPPVPNKHCHTAWRCHSILSPWICCVMISEFNRKFSTKLPEASTWRVLFQCPTASTRPWLICRDIIHSDRSTRHDERLRLQVASRLCTMAFTGPVAYAPPAMRAACAFLPEAALPAFIQRLSRSAEDCLARRACDAQAVNGAHVLVQLMRNAPGQVAESATRLVEWVMDDLLQSSAIHEAAEQGCLEQSLDLTVGNSTLTTFWDVKCHANVFMHQAKVWAPVIQRTHF